MTYIAELDRVLSDGVGTNYVTFKLLGQFVADKFKNKKLELTVAEKRNKRSLNANSYFHVLVDKIAEVLSAGNEETKTRLVLDYGTPMINDGVKVGIKLPKAVDVKLLYPYAKWFDERTEGGKAFNCYIIYKQTRYLDTAEMARLIDGTISEAKALDIETITPAERELMLAHWEGME